MGTGPMEEGLVLWDLSPVLDLDLSRVPVPLLKKNPYTYFFS